MRGSVGVFERVGVGGNWVGGRGLKREAIMRLGGNNERWGVVCIGVKRWGSLVYVGEWSN